MQSICNVFQDDLVVFVQFKKRDKRTWKSDKIIEQVLRPLQLKRRKTE